MNPKIFQAEMEAEEGRRSTVYTDSLGVLTLGIGHNGNKPISDRAIQVIYEDDVSDARRDLDRLASWWRDMTERRQHALLGMCFQMGWPRLSGFHGMLTAMKDGNYDLAAAEALDSKWAEQTPERARRVATAIREG